MATYLNSTLEDVKFHIDNQDFDGPIDLLVKMVRESKIDIMDIFVSDITSQYIHYVENLKELDYEYVSHYIVMAAILIEIKSARMMPAQDEDDPYQSEIEETAEQIISDVQRNLLLSTPEKLRETEVTNVFYNEPKYDKDDYKLIVKAIDLNKLLDAYMLVIERTEIIDKAPQVQTIEKETFSVADKVKELSGELRTKKKVSFFSLFTNANTRSELLNVFLAVLILVKKQVAMAMQGEYHGDIMLVHNEENDKPLRDEELKDDVDEYN